MCGRVVSTSASDALADLFRAEVALEREPPPNYNLAPTDPIRAVAETSGGRQLRVFRWGLVPSSAAAPGQGPLMINARAETVTTKGVFAHLLLGRRCIVPVDGFYEWQRLDDKRRQPFFAHPTNGDVLALAGLWDVWRGEGQVIPSLTIITTGANETMRLVHERMPVVLPADRWDLWLDPSMRETEHLRSLLVPAEADVVQLRPVSPAVNSVRNNTSDLLLPVPATGGTLF
jgi:putative SOS response-associated peptidase YedK